jgi:acetoin utilization deacetylase AcuC-like enzyme
MRIVFSENHREHFPQGEFYGGILKTPNERPQRMEFILREFRKRKMTDIVPPGALDMKAVRKVHDKGYVSFLASIWEEWLAAGNRGDVFPSVIPNRSLQQRLPRWVDGKIGYYAHSIETPITAGTWDAARSSAAVALTAQRIVADGARAAFALCRPPGHHAHDDLYGGYCFLNNAAIAAQAFIDGGAQRVAILDVDFHHGNGTQDIFYHRKDVLFVSLHGAPEDAYPHFLGYKDEKGEGPGEGFNVNYPMLPGTKYDVWSEALKHGLRKIKQFRPDVLVVSLGVDAYKDDPVGFFKLTSEDFSRMGGEIGKLRLPTLLVMEGGYAIEAIGINTANAIEGFENA